MTTELEQEFFKVFGIEPIPIKSYGYWLIKGSVAENDKGEKVVYPEITDRVLLELIFRLIKYEETFEDSQFKNIKELKNYILAKSISIKTTGDKWLVRQIQQLFKEEE